MVFLAVGVALVIYCSLGGFLFLIVFDSLKLNRLEAEQVRRDHEAERLMWTQERLGMLERLDALRTPSLVVAEPVAAPRPAAPDPRIGEEQEYLLEERQRLEQVLADNGVL